MVMAQLQDWKVLLAPSTCFCHIPAPCWAWTTSPIGLNGKDKQACRWEAALVQPVASETQAISHHLPCLEVAEVLFSIRPWPHSQGL